MNQTELIPGTVDVDPPDTRRLKTRLDRRRLVGRAGRDEVVRPKAWGNRVKGLSWESERSRCRC